MLHASIEDVVHRYAFLGLTFRRPFREDETFGSWFRAVAAMHHVTREKLLRALLRCELPSEKTEDFDWDLDPPPKAVEAVLNTPLR